jgi:hypothetical protein
MGSEPPAQRFGPAGSLTFRRPRVAVRTAFDLPEEPMRKILLVPAALAMLLFSLARAAGEESPAGVTPEQAKAAYERFVALEGVWAGQSTKGWSDSVVYRTMAAGSVVMQTSFEAHPGEMMVTMVHPDGDRLLLTHYCVAKNQPRLVLSECTDGGAQVTFSFLDGTNMPNRDRGHMDKVVFRFFGADSFSSRWTWYRSGTENWMEDIRYTRLHALTAVQAADR